MRLEIANEAGNKVKKVIKAKTKRVKKAMQRMLLIN